MESRGPFQSDDKKAKDALYADLMRGFAQIKAHAETTSFNSDPDKYAKKPKKNKHAALSHEDVAEVKMAADAVLKDFPLLATQDNDLWRLITTANALAQNIQSCDLPTDLEDYASIVTVVQGKAQEILDCHDSWLKKILRIALISRQYGYGNCQEKAFYAFALLLPHLFGKKPLVTSLELAFFNNHFIVIVNNELLVDPWLNLAFPLSKQNPHQNIYIVFRGFGVLTKYFYVNRDVCVTQTVSEAATIAIDLRSKHDLPACLVFLKNHSKHFALTLSHKRKTEEALEHEQKYMGNMDHERVGTSKVSIFKRNPSTEKNQGEAPEELDVSPTEKSYF